MSLHTDGLRKRVLDTLDRSPYRGEIHVSEPQNNSDYGTFHELRFRGRIVYIEFGSRLSYIYVDDRSFARNLIYVDGRLLLVGGRDLDGVSVHDRIIMLEEHGTRFSFLAYDSVHEHRKFEAVLRAAMHVALDFAVLVE